MNLIKTILDLRLQQPSIVYYHSDHIIISVQQRASERVVPLVPMLL